MSMNHASNSSFPPKNQPAFMLELTHSLLPGIPVYQVHGALADQGWGSLVEACGLEPSHLRVIDFSGVTHCDSQTSDAASFARRLSREGSPMTSSACHVLIAPGDLLFGFCRVIQSHLDMAGQKAAVVRSLTAAQQWLRTEGLIR
jgi:hypothetical protein